jgi:hypothetical protein
MKLAEENFRADRLPSFAAAALFLFFLLYSAPHRVHHSFEEHDAPSACLVFSVAKGCSLDSPSSVDFSITRILVEPPVPSLKVWTPYFLSSPFSQRAPPTA